MISANEGATQGHATLAGTQSLPRAIGDMNSPALQGVLSWQLGASGY